MPGVSTSTSLVFLNPVLATLSVEPCSADTAKIFSPAKRVEQRALAGTDFAEGRDLDAAVFEFRGEFLDLVHFLLDGRALFGTQPRVAGQLAQRFDRIGQ